MKEYAIKITETLEEVVTVEASSVQEARCRAFSGRNL